MLNQSETHAEVNPIYLMLSKYLWYEQFAALVAVMAATPNWESKLLGTIAIGSTMILHAANEYHVYKRVQNLAPKT